MGKAKGYYTLEQLAAIQKMVEERAAILKKIGACYTPAERAAIQKMVVRDAAEDAAELDKARKTIDRINAIRDGLIPPPWAEKLLNPANERKAKPASKRKAKPRSKPQVDRAIPILIELHPPSGIPPAHILLKTTTADVNKVIAERNKVLTEDRKEPLMKLDSVSRAILILKKRNAP
jgi:hypothetical protein